MALDLVLRPPWAPLVALSMGLIAFLTILLLRRMRGHEELPEASGSESPSVTAFVDVLVASGMPPAEVCRATGISRDLLQLQLRTADRPPPDPPRTPEGRVV